MLYKNFLIFLALMSPLCCISGSRIDSENFCKLAENDCSQRNAPHIYQCGSKICARNETKCNEYLAEKNGLETNSLSLFARALSFLRNNYDKRFESNLKNCSQTAYEWQSSDMCIRGRNCLQSRVEFVKSKLVFYIQKKKVLTKVDCPCPKNKPYICGGRQSSFCALSKQACDSFIYKIKNKNSNKGSGLEAIQNCENDFTLID